MTTNMRNAIEQAACEVGRALAKYEMLISGAGSLNVAGPVTGPVSGPVGVTFNGASKRPGRVAKAGNATTTKATKSRKASRGAHKEPGPRTPGVKKAILALITSEPVMTADIIARTGFKAASVNGTLQSLKKEGLVSQNEDKLWNPAQITHSSNSDTEATANNGY